ncbi:pathogenesis-related thaumatin-like protein 3.5 [Spinacia oleracea]|uniref:Pathogenesis-related thaumatin-like protein 3.5 n=1 Tax=Spinacia oleracea TaxID=3562 RepID=A0A9R0J060_SPIOL|nr:pathogenesis-related thaumatin-like protein 3.5 [Spinacia oleracea]
MQQKLLFKLNKFITILLILIFPYTVSSTFTVTNNCPFTIWPGTLSGSGTPALSSTGFQLDSGKSARLEAVPGWSGRIWARTGCKFDVTGAGKCQTGDCGGRLECDGSGATPPASLFEITLGQGSNKDFYDVSMVDGYNLPLVAWPTGTNGAACNATGCISDLNMGCPKELQVMGGDGGGGVIACKSACEAFGLDHYCCSGQFANPTTCQPSFYSQVFKRACPRAYSYAFDDASSTFTCKAYNYAIVFCPKSAAVTRNPNNGAATPPPTIPYNPPPTGGAAMSPPSIPYDSPPTGGAAISPPTGGAARSPPSFTYSPPVGGTAMSPPNTPYKLPPSPTYSSPPIGSAAKSPPNIPFTSPPSFSYNSPPIGQDTQPSPVGDSAPPFINHSFGESEGEVSSSYTLLPYPVYTLLTFISLLLLR